MQHHIRQSMLITAFVTALLGGTLAQTTEESKLDMLPSTSGEWETALSDRVYEGIPVAQAQERQAGMASHLKHLGLERVWQMTGDQQVQEGWYSTLLGVTVITKATTGQTASLTARVMAGQVTQQAFMAAAGN